MTSMTRWPRTLSVLAAEELAAFVQAFDDELVRAALRPGRPPKEVLETRLGQVLNDAKRYGLIESNPARDADRLAESEPEGNYLEPFQVGPLLRELPARYRVLFELMLRAGLRIGEATGLRWQHVDFPRSLLRLRRTARAGRVSKTTKSGDREALVH